MKQKTYRLKTRIIAFILMLLTVFYAIPVSVFAEAAFSESVDNNASLTGYPQATVNNVILTESISASERSIVEGGHFENSSINSSGSVLVPNSNLWSQTTQMWNMLCRVNPRSVRSGIRQLQRYNKALGGGFTLRLELY